MRARMRKKSHVRVARALDESANPKSLNPEPLKFQLRHALYAATDTLSLTVTLELSVFQFGFTWLWGLRYKPPPPPTLQSPGPKTSLNPEDDLHLLCVDLKPQSSTSTPQQNRGQGFQDAGGRHQGFLLQLQLLLQVPEKFFCRNHT